MAKPLSVFILTLNEIDRVGHAIASVKAIANEIIVIDSGSTDGTQAFAQSLGARVVHNDWHGYGLQKQFGEDQCVHDWMLNIDADEAVSEDLAQAISLVLADPTIIPKAFKTKILEMFPGETKPHPWAFALSPVRFYHKAAGRYSASPVHDRVDLASDVEVLPLSGIIEHRSIRSLSHELTKLNAYTDLQAADMARKGRKLSTLRLVLEFPLAFLKAYIARRHFIRGRYGFMTAMNYAFFRYLRAAKHWEMRINSTI